MDKYDDDDYDYSVLQPGVDEFGTMSSAIPQEKTGSDDIRQTYNPFRRSETDVSNAGGFPEKSRDRGSVTPAAIDRKRSPFTPSLKRGLSPGDLASQNQALSHVYSKPLKQRMSVIQKTKERHMYLQMIDQCLKNVPTKLDVRDGATVEKWLKKVQDDCGMVIRFRKFYTKMEELVEGKLKDKVELCMDSIDVRRLMKGTQELGFSTSAVGLKRQNQLFDEDLFVDTEVEMI